MSFYLSEEDWLKNSIPHIPDSYFEFKINHPVKHRIKSIMYEVLCLPSTIFYYLHRSLLKLTNKKKYLLMKQRDKRHKQFIEDYEQFIRECIRNGY